MSSKSIVNNKQNSKENIDRMMSYSHLQNKNLFSYYLHVHLIQICIQVNEKKNY